MAVEYEQQQIFPKAYVTGDSLLVMFSEMLPKKSMASRPFYDRKGILVRLVSWTVLYMTSITSERFIKCLLALIHINLFILAHWL